MISATLDSNQLRKTDHIHVINQVVEKYAEYTKPQCITFIDYEKTLNSGNR